MRCFEQRRRREGPCPHHTSTAWNFTKFLITRDGKIAGRYEPNVKPESKELVKAIEAELEKK
jgi:glutathione peroxidase